MDVTFRTNELRERYTTEKKAKRAWGGPVARMYRDRVNVLYAAADHRTLAALAYLRFHPLRGDRQGQYAISLGRDYRLIVTFQNEQFTVVRVEEVTDHYGD